MHGRLCLLAPKRLRNAGRSVPLHRSILITLSHCIAIRVPGNNALSSTNEALLSTVQILLFCHPRPQVEGDPNINNSGTNTFLVSSKLEVEIPHCLRHISSCYVFRKGTAESRKRTLNTEANIACYTVC